MSEHVAMNTGCNEGCTYCYEEPDREINGNKVQEEYDMDKVMARLEEWKEKRPNTVPGMHGGEPLLVRDEDLETIFSWIHENYDDNSHIQTNATLISDEHIRMFKEYNVHVGISCDGPGELNSERQARKGGEDVTDEFTNLTHEAIDKMIEEGVSLGIITVLHKTNAGTDEKLEKLLDWIDYLNRNGVIGHYNPAIPYEDVQEDISLSPERLEEVYLKTWDWIKEEPYRSWNPMRQFVDNLLGAQLGNCVNNKCDVYNAGAAKIIKGNGESTGCGKTWSTVGDGVPFLQGPSSGNKYDDTEERYDMLKKVPQSEGGCKGCDYWNVCQGGCPSAGIDDDHRNRTLWCQAKYSLYEKIEHDLRAILPNIDLITDLPWDADIADASSKWDLNIQPFGRMDPSKEGKASSYSQTNHPGGIIDERVPDEVVPEKPFDEKVEMYQEKHGEEAVSYSKEEGWIHADSALEGYEKVEEEEGGEEQ